VNSLDNSSSVASLTKFIADRRAADRIKKVQDSHLIELIQDMNNGSVATSQSKNFRQQRRVFHFVARLAKRLTK